VFDFIYDVSKSTLEVEELYEVTKEAIERIIPLKLSPKELIDLLYFLPAGYIDHLMTIYTEEYELSTEYVREFEDLFVKTHRDDFESKIDLDKSRIELRFTLSPSKKLLDRTVIIAVLQAYNEFKPFTYEYDGDNMYVKRAYEIYKQLQVIKSENKLYKIWMKTKDERVKLLISRIEKLEAKFSI